MPLVSDLERYFTEKGREEGQRIGFVEAIALGLDLKFGAEGLALMPQVEKIEDLGVLQTLTKTIKPAVSLDEIRKLLPPAPAE
jgi:hypothetical protein